MQQQVLGLASLLSLEDLMEVGKVDGFHIRYRLEATIYPQLLQPRLEVLRPLVVLAQLGLEETGRKIVPLQLTALALLGRPHLAKL